MAIVLYVSQPTDPTLYHLLPSQFIWDWRMDWAKLTREEAVVKKLQKKYSIIYSL
jgi:hypothetical protein